MALTLAATDTMVGLTDGRYRTVVADEVLLTQLPVVGVFQILRHSTFVHQLVVVQQDGRDVDAVRTRHAILTIVTRMGAIAVLCIFCTINTKKTISEQNSVLQAGAVEAPMNTPENIVTDEAPAQEASEANN